MMVFKLLNRRTQKESCNWYGFTEILSYFKVPRPQISDIENNLALVQADNAEEPCAGKLMAGICKRALGQLAGLS